MMNENLFDVEVTKDRKLVIYNRLTHDEIVCKAEQLSLLCDLIEEKLKFPQSSMEVFEKNELTEYGIMNNFITIDTCQFILEYIGDIYFGNSTDKGLKSLPIKGLELLRIFTKLKLESNRNGRRNNV